MCVYERERRADIGAGPVCLGTGSFESRSKRSIAPRSPAKGVAPSRRRKVFGGISLCVFLTSPPTPLSKKDTQQRKTAAHCHQDSARFSVLVTNKQSTTTTSSSSSYSITMRQLN